MFLTQIANGKLRDMVLCHECARKEGIFDPQQLSIASQFFPKELSGHIEKLISHILRSGADEEDDLTHLPNHIFSLHTQTSSELPGYPDAVQQPKKCPQCGYTYADYVRTHRMGCPKCYDVFRDMLQLPKEASSDEVSERQTESVEKLEEEMMAAVEREDYEEAAKLRDRIKSRREE